MKTNIIKTIKNWPKRIKIITTAILIILISIGTYFYFTKSKNSEAETTTITAVKSNIENSITLSGTIVQSNMFTITTKATGLVDNVYVTDGQQVMSGQKIADITLDTVGKANQTQAWASYQSAKNALDSAKTKQWTLESTMWSANQTFIHDAVDLGKDETSAEYIQTNRDWLAAQANYYQQEQVISQAQTSLSQSWYSYQQYTSNITAPASGTIIGLNIAPGLVISSSDSSNQIATIEVEGLPLASFYATEVDINKISTDQQADIIIDSLPEEKISGHVVAVDRAGQVNSGVTQYEVIIQLDQTPEGILPNMTTTATIILESKENVISIPLSAVVTRGDKKVVRILKDGNPTPMEVETGIETDTMIEIISGISEGDQIITDSTTTSQSGTQQFPRTGGGLGIPGAGGGAFHP